jgi:phenylalanyl-tRNA synthetase beta chain
MLFSRRWLGDYVDLPADTARVAERLTFAGFTVEGVKRLAPAAGEATRDAGVADLTDDVLDIDVTTNRPDCMNHFGLARELSVLFAAPLSPPGTRPLPLSAVPQPATPEIPETAEITVEVEVEVEDPADCPRYVARVVDGVRVAPSPAWLVRCLEAIGQRSINNVVDVTNFVLWEMGQPLHAFDLDRLEGGRIVVRRGRPGERLTTLDGVDRPVDADVLVIAEAARPVGLAGVMGGRDSEVTAGTTRLLLESACFERALVRRTAKRLGLHTDASHRFERGTDLEACLAAADRAAALIAALAGGTVVPGAVDVRAAVPAPRTGHLVLARLNAFAGAEVRAEDVERWLVGLGFGLRPVALAEAGEAGGTAGIDGTERTVRGAAAARPAWQVTVPTWRRFDFEPGPDGFVYEADLFEEVLRIHGLDSIPAALPALPGSDGPRTERQRVRGHVRRLLAGAGFAEAVNFGFEDPRVASGLPTLRPGVAPLMLANPLSEHHSAMRRSLLGNLLESARFNQRRGAAAVRLFEVGTVFFPRSSSPDPGRVGAIGGGAGQPASGGSPTASAGAAKVHPHDRSAELPDEQEHVAVVCGGHVGSPWDREATLDLFDLKGAIEVLAEALDVRLTARAAVLPGMRAGSAAELLDRAGRVVGLLGRLEAEEGYPLYAGELALAALEGGDLVRSLAAPPRVPGISADCTLTHSLQVTWHDLAAAIEARRPPDLAEFALKNRYHGEGVPAGAVNTTLTFHYNAGDRSLTQDEVNERQLELAAELTRRFGWKG